MGKKFPKHLYPTYVRHGKDRKGQTLLWTKEHDHPWVIHATNNYALTLEGEDVLVEARVSTKWGRDRNVFYFRFPVKVLLDSGELEYQVPWEKRKPRVNPMRDSVKVCGDHVEPLAAFLLALVKARPNLPLREPTTSYQGEMVNGKPEVREIHKTYYLKDRWTKPIVFTHVSVDWCAQVESERVLDPDEYEVVGWREYSVQGYYAGFGGTTEARASGEELVAKVKASGKEVILDQRRNYYGETKVLD